VQIGRGGAARRSRGLEDQVGLVCAKALDLQPAEGRLMRGVLVALLVRADALSVALLHAGQTTD